MDPNDTTEQARQVVEQLAKIIRDHDPETLLAVIEQKVSGPEVRAALVLMVLLDRERQRGPVRFEIDLESLDFLAEAKDEPRAILSLVRRLDESEQREALANLIALHHDLTEAEIRAARAARDN